MAEKFKTLGEAIAAARTAYRGPRQRAHYWRGLTQSELATACETFSREQLAQWEYGSRRAPALAIRKIEQVLGVTFKLDERVQMTVALPHRSGLWYCTERGPVSIDQSQSAPA